MEKPPQPKPHQVIHNERLKKICEDLYDKLEQARTPTAIAEVKVDFLKGIGSNLGVKPTVAAIKHSKKVKPGRKNQYQLAKEKKEQESQQE